MATPVRAVGLLTYGNASQPGSGHRDDQLPLLAAKQYRPLWTRREQVLPHVERRTVFGATPVPSTTEIPQ
ncbi:MAG: penicillin acylase family protein [Pseudomonas sp.]